MPERRFMVGERVLASRDQSGTAHEEATVCDFYEMLIGPEKIPQVVVDFDDGQRVWMTAREPNVLPIEEDQMADEFDGEEGLEDDAASEDGATAAVVEDDLGDDESEPGDSWDPDDE